MSKRSYETLNTESESSVKVEKSTTDVFHEALSLLEDTVPVGLKIKQ